eukprot:CAMPEP_0178408190 /NCGR_PEP_ID=MMETSP0689_2-20121128/19812_1 /TAXON_ID=160604 /ORGANISM="Amphidinium massartii, Strain CS-259" /LENGTH=279 /DNA_ID=CAMNT_0020029279 /DNA_START=70 /DNA_END=910 /DNA_ORIENTATION=-
MSAWAKIECSSCSAAMWAPRSSAAQETAAKPKCRRCVLGLTTNETCMICFEKVKVGVKLNHRSDACEHPCCLTCMRTYLFYKIEDGVFHIRCPHEGCSMQYYEGDMRKILGPSMHIVEDAKTREKCQQALERVTVFLRQEHGAHLVEVLRQALLQQKLQPALGQEETIEALQRDESCASSSASSTASPSSAEAASEASEEQHQDDGLHHFGSWALDACQACPSCNVIVRKEEDATTSLADAVPTFATGAERPWMASASAQTEGQLHVWGHTQTCGWASG